jgi:O-antigen ligase
MINSTANKLLLGLGTLLAASSMLSVAISQIALALCLILLIIGVINKWWPMPKTGLELPFALFVGWGLFTILFSTHPAESVAFAKRYFIYSALWVGASIATTNKARTWLLTAIISSAVINALYSLITQVPGNYTHRATLIQDSSMTGAWLIAGAIVIALSVALTAPHRKAKLISCISIAPLLAILIFTWTRSGWIGMLGGVAVLLLMLRPKWVIGLVIITALLIGFGPDKIKSRASSILDPSQKSNAARIEMYRAGIDLIKEHPITGVGDQSLKKYSPVSIYRGKEVRHAHFHQNQITMTVLWGIPGLIFGVGFLVAAGIKLFKKRRLLTDNCWQKTWLTAGFGVWVVFNVIGFVDWSFGDAEMSLFFFLVTGIALGKD